MARPRLHLDADTSIKAVYTGLMTRGHDITRTPNAWMPHDAEDVDQLLGATAHGRVLFTFNIRDFLDLALHYPHHADLLLADQRRWRPSGLLEP